MDARDLSSAILPGDIRLRGATMRYARTFATPDGESHFEDVDVRHDSVEIVPRLPPIDVGERIATAYSNLLRIPPNWDGDWHPSPKRWFALTLSGEMEITSSDGEYPALRAGIDLADRRHDREGASHPYHR